MAKSTVERRIAAVTDSQVGRLEHVGDPDRWGGVRAALLDNCDHVPYKRLQDHLGLDGHEVSTVFRHRN